MRLLQGFDGFDRNGRRYVVRCRLWSSKDEIAELVAKRRAEYAQRSVPRRGIKWPDYWDREEA